MTERKTEFLSMPEGGSGSGATAEQLAQIAQNAEDIAELRAAMGDFELLTSLELEASVNEISFDLGKTVEELYILCESPEVTATGARRWYNQDGIMIGFWSSNVLSTSSSRYVVTRFYSINGFKKVCETRYGTNSLSVTAICANYCEVSGDISKIKLSGSSSTEPGTKFKVWGR